MKRLALLALLLLAPGVHAQDDAFFERLSSEDHEVVLKALREHGGAVPSVDALRLMLELATGRDAPLAHASRDALDALGVKLAPRLLRIARDGGRIAATSIRLVGRYAGEAASPKLLEFLDSDDRRLRQAAAGILAKKGHAVLDDVRARLATLKKKVEKGERDEELDTRVADHLAIISGLKTFDAVQVILEFRAIGSERLLRYTDSILARDHAATFRPIAARQLREGDDRNRDYLMRYLAAHGHPDDRRLGFELWKREHGDAVPEVAAALDAILRGTRDWLGIIATPEDLESVTYGLKIENHRKSATVEHRLSSRFARHHHGPLLRGVALDLPLGRALMEPLGCTFELREKEGERILEVRFPDATPCRFGIGNVIERRWAVRFGFDVARIETELGPGSIPRRTRCFDGAGKPVGRIDYLVADRKLSAVVVESGGITLEAFYVPAAAGRRLKLAAISRNEDERESLWVKATVNDFRIRKKTPQPEDR